MHWYFPSVPQSAHARGDDAPNVYKEYQNDPTKPTSYFSTYALSQVGNKKISPLESGSSPTPVKKQ